MTLSSHLARRDHIDETIDVLDADGNIVAESRPSRSSKRRPGSPARRRPSTREYDTARSPIQAATAGLTPVGPLLFVPCWRRLPAADFDGFGDRALVQARIIKSGCTAGNSFVRILEIQFRCCRWRIRCLKGWRFGLLLGLGRPIASTLAAEISSACAAVSSRLRRVGRVPQTCVAAGHIIGAEFRNS